MGLKSQVRRLLPRPILSIYHRVLAYLGALLYRFPSRSLTVIAVTGTDGKSSTTEYINAIFEAAGYTTALSNSIRVKIAEDSHPSTGRSMPGRFFIQRFMRRALQRGCEIAIVEMTSEGARQHRHRAIALDCLVFTNLSPEHIESHGSLEAYANAKYEIGRALARSSKRPRIIVANSDDAEGPRYLSLPVEQVRGFSLSDAQPYEANERGGFFTFEATQINVAMPGVFSLKNALAAAHVARAFGIDTETIRAGIASVTEIPGRLQRIDSDLGFSVVIDYALTPEALEALYRTYAAEKKICVFGCAGGGRDTWKRPVLGKLAEQYCEQVILTNDVAYEEDPRTIIKEIAAGMHKKPLVEMDRRKAIRHALESAQNVPGSVVLLTGMGVDTEITGPGGRIEPWNEAAVVREEIAQLRV